MPRFSVIPPKPYRPLILIGMLALACVFGGSAILANTEAKSIPKTAAATETTEGETDTPKTLPDPLLVEFTTSHGTIVLQLEPQRAPFSVQNFLAYIESGFYTDTIFHRVIEGFMIQGGGFTDSYQRKETQAPVQNEANNGLKNDRYTIAMARTSAPHSATAQFFINAANNDYLNHTEPTPQGWGYTVFGKVVEGKSVVDAIALLETSAGGSFSRDVPTTQVTIDSARILYTEAAAPIAEPADSDAKDTESE